MPYVDFAQALTPPPEACALEGNRNYWILEEWWQGRKIDKTSKYAISIRHYLHGAAMLSENEKQQEELIFLWQLLWGVIDNWELDDG